METPVRELPIYAEQLALDFANTVDDPLGPSRYDHVADYAGLLAWSERVGIVNARAATHLREQADTHPRRAAAVVRRGRALREAIETTFGALADGTSHDAGWEQLHPFVADAVQRASLVPAERGAGLKAVWAFEDLGSPLWPIAESAYALLTSPHVVRVKRCAGCPWLFLDHSKNGSRRWCSMDDCGKHEKIRKYVQRRAERRLS